MGTNYLKNGMLFVLGMGIVMTSCSSDADDEGAYFEPDYQTVSHISLSRAEAQSNDAVNEFGLKYLTYLTDKYPDKNNAVSPVSLGIGITLYANIEGETNATKIANGYKCENLAELNGLINKLVTFLPDKSNKCSLAMANAVWYDPTLNISPSEDFLARVLQTLHADVQSLAYLADSEATKIINKWASDKTHGLINRITDDNTRNNEMFFANALYFKAKWGLKFDAKDTRAEVFHAPDSDVKVPMMHTKAHVCRVFNPEHRYWFVKIPYEGNVEMVVILPPERVAISQFLKDLDWDVLSDEVIDDYAPFEIKIGLPKFESENAYAYDFAIWDLLGVDDYSQNANISGMLGYDYPYPGCDITHFTHVKVNEAGTEAAAVTSDLILTGPPIGEQVFAADRPFVYLIRNTVTGSLIMAGTVVQP